eukprot:gene39425-49731_t
MRPPPRAGGDAAVCDGLVDELQAKIRVAGRWAAAD